MSGRIIKQGTIFSTLLLSFFVMVPAVAADPKPNIQHASVSAKYVSQTISDPITIEAGKTKSVTIKFKNTGTETWNSLSQHPNGYRHVSAYTMEPRYRDSQFFTSGWISKRQTASISKDTKPGETAELTINLKAPTTPGNYKEEFYLAAENYTWIDGGYFYLDVKVTPSVSADASTAPPTRGSDNPAPSESAETLQYKAHKFLQSIQSVEAAGGERVKLILAFQNLGEKEWEEYSILSNQPTALAGTSLSFADSAWYNASTVLKKAKPVSPGGIFRETITFRTPAKVGEYTAEFRLAINDTPVDGALIEIPITVTSNAPGHYVAPHTSPGTEAPPSVRLEAEPRIRVGLWQNPDFVQFRSADDDYEVFAGITKIATLPKNKTGILKYKDGQYTFSGLGADISGDQFLRLVPVNNPHASFTLWNYERYVKWKGPNNFNSYHGAVELRKGEIRDDIWLVNELLMEDYVQGIGENSNGAPTEYLKSQTVAQRSYAYATIQSDKYGIFDVVATTGDQLYLGVEVERITPNFVNAAKATRGRMATYDGRVVITPYFGNSDCRTRAWTEVWGGSHKPWLVPVKTTYDCNRGRRMNGHGVGMSQLDAAGRADAEGLGFEALVKYYYTGVNVEKVYD